MVDYAILPARPAANRLVAIASSAGGLEALSEVLQRLPATFGAAVLVVQHLEPDRVSHLAHILGSRTPLIVVQAEAGVLPLDGTVYVAPPGVHLVVGPSHRLAL